MASPGLLETFKIVNIKSLLELIKFTNFRVGNTDKLGVQNVYSREFRYLLVGETSQGRRFW